LVLAIFMGGMALGAWIASRLSPRWRDLLLAYALVEVLIGLASLAFTAPSSRPRRSPSTKSFPGWDRRSRRKFSSGRWLRF